MRFSYFKILLFFAFVLRGVTAFGQIANDECQTAINIPNAKDFCGRYTNVGATKSTYDGSSCFILGNNDVWFTFTAIATTVTINVYGKSVSTPNFTLVDAQAVLYYGQCGGSISELGCGQTTTSSFGSLDITKSGLIVGEQYLIRVAGARTATGTFNLCIKNYNLPANIDSDCPTAAVLCDKSPFSVKYLVGQGKVPNEFSDAPCLGGNTSGTGTLTESNSAWFQWTCEKSGSLTLKITPNFLGDSISPTGPQGAIGDDIDFAVYEINGIGNCSGKKLLRCEGAGPFIFRGCSVQSALRCFGATGLREQSNGISEDGGCPCNEPRENFLKALDMVAGKTYAIGINNFSGTGNGFYIEFGGTGTFVGPEAKIGINKTDKKYCLGEDVVFSDGSSFALGQITNRQWRFGKGASLDTANGSGPFKVFYKTPGWKAVVLTVTTNRGCTVTSILDSIYVEPFKYDSLIRRPTCQLGTDGLIRLKVVNCGRPPLRYNWENTGYTTRDSIAGLSSGRYKVAVTDSSGVYVDTIFFNLKTFEVELDTAKRIVTPPKCFGQTNGKIELNPKTGTAPFQYRWNNSPNATFDNIYAPIGEGQFSVEIRDANNCKGIFNFDVRQPDKMDVTLDTFNITCFGKTDGAAIAYPSGGVGNYSVSWSRGDVGDTVRNLRAGQYTVFARDSNFCEVTKGLRIIEPPQIGLVTLRIKPAKCYGDSTAELVVLGNGGTPPFRYSIDGVRFQRDTAFLKIPGKLYNVVVRDSTGCRRTLEVNVPQPPQLQVSAGPDLEVELGFPVDLRAVVVPSSKLVSYVWTPKDSALVCPTCARTTLTPLRSKQYRVTVKDSLGCIAFDELLVNVIKKRPIFIPTAFSPNADGVNDYFTLFGNQAAVEIKELVVFNRWGDLLFTGKNLPMNVENRGWDGTFNGKNITPDVFAFYAVVKFIDGEEIIYKGDVTLLR